MVGWVEGHQRRLTTVPMAMMSKKKGAMMARFARRACTGGTMSLRRRWWSAVREGQKEGSNGDRRALSSASPIHKHEQQPERERESGMMREEGLAPHLDPVGQFSFSPVYL
jgi:hypothetical protein